MKRLWICILHLPVLLNSCKDKNKIDPDAEEYFSFYADGEYFYYPQEKGSSIGVGNWKTLSAGKSGTTAYIIYAYNSRYHSNTNPTNPGAFLFEFSSNHMPEQDTIIIDGNTTRASIQRLGNQDNYYSLVYPLTGKIIFTQRNKEKLVGIFEFDAYKYITDTVGLGVIYTDTIIHITQGKFSIIPSH
jgi:hypothetical protein